MTKKKSNAGAKKSDFKKVKKEEELPVDVAFRKIKEMMYHHEIVQGQKLIYQELAKKLNMKVVAEGVENQEDWDLVARLGCDQVQGYFVARPMPFNQLAKWLKDPEVLKRFTPLA